MDLTARMTGKQLRQFVDFIEELSGQIGFKVSSRGWGYILEQRGMIDKSQFDKVEGVINRCRREGLLPVDFVAEEAARAFSNVEEPSSESHAAHVKGWVEAALDSHRYYTPDWWEGEEVYIQMVVEKIDLVTLFQPICARYHIPIANAKGWSSIMQRAEYCRRFAEAEKRGLRCVLLYCGDHDPDGLRISQTLRKNLEDVARIRWEDGTDGYDPSELEIARFGLEYDFIKANKLTWIDNLITGAGKDLGDAGQMVTCDECDGAGEIKKTKCKECDGEGEIRKGHHPNHFLPYVQNYLSKVGRRKCEANSLVVIPEMGRRLCEKTLLKYLGSDAEARFRRKREQVKERINDALEDSGAGKLVRRAIKLLDEYEV